MNAFAKICMSALFPGAAQVMAESPKGDGHPVIVLPGFFTGPNHTLLLRTALKHANYRPLDWGQGFNFGPSDEMVARLSNLLATTHAEHGRVSLVGWSLGGLLARAIANANPDAVRHLITLGSPHKGDPTQSKLAPLFELFSPLKLNELTAEHIASIRNDPPVPTTCVYTKSDEVVDWQDCLSSATNAVNIEVQGGHSTLTHNAEALRAILEALAC